MKNLIKKNQLMISALAVMLAIAGYLQFSGKNDAKEEMKENATVSEVGSGDILVQEYVLDDVLSDTLSQEGLAQVDLLDAGDVTEVLPENVLEATTGLDEVSMVEAIPEAGEIPGNSIFTAENGVTVLAQAKLLKEQVRAKNKDMLMEIVNNNDLSAEEKQVAVNSIVAMTDYAEKEAAAQILLEAKGFEGAVVSLNGEGADVVVNALELTDAQLVQIEDILIRKTGLSAEKIVISTLVP